MEMTNKKVAVHLLFQNMRSYRGNYEKLCEYLDEHDYPTIIAMQEMWLPHATQLNLPNYHTCQIKLRSKSNANAGGGVGILINKELDFIELDTPFISKIIETQTFYIKSLNLLISNVYIPLKLREMSHLEVFLLEIRSHCKTYKPQQIVIGGDFNANYQEKSEYADLINTLFSENALLKISNNNTKFTNINGVLNCSELDAIYCNKTLSTYTLDTQISDHVGLAVDLPAIEKPTVNTVLKRNFSSKNLWLLKKYFTAYDWTEVISCGDRSVFKKFHKILKSGLDIICPKKESKVTATKRKHRWMTLGLLVSRKTKLQEYKLFKAGKHNRYKQYSRVYYKTIRKAKYLYLQDIISSKDSKKIWSETLSVLGVNTANSARIQHLTINNEVITDKKGIADSFNDFFAKVGENLAKKTNPDGTHLTYVDKPQTKFSLQTITNEDLILIMRTVLNKKSSGFDEYSNYLIKQIYKSIEIPLVHVINCSISLKFVPVEWKTAKIKPLFKKGNPDDPSNYRPISLLSGFSKIVEKVVEKQLRKYLEDNNLITTSQFGFRQKYETTYAILKITNELYNNNEKDLISLAVFADLKKAFDTVNHEILLDKMQKLGIDNSWFKSYLNNRDLITDFEGTLSDKVPLTVGVPQGSVLGPLMFLLYINDLPKVTSGKIYLFADDTTILYSAKTTAELEQTVNRDLVMVNKWFLTNALTVHVDKTNYIIFNNNYAESINITMNNKPLEKISETKFVGVMLDKDLNWNSHINHVGNKMNKGLYLLGTGKTYLPKKIKILLYNALIRSHFEYAVLAWGHKINKTLITKQKKALRLICSVSYNAHTMPLLDELELLTVEDTYQYRIMSLAFRSTLEDIPAQISEDIPLYSNSRNTRSAPHFRTKHYKKKNLNFQEILPKTWNNFESFVKIERSDSFYYNLKQYFLTTYRQWKCLSSRCYSCKKQQK